MARYDRTPCSFINPYNFVPVDLTKTKRRNATEKSEALLTGYFRCGIRCRTPLAIPDTEHKEEWGREHYKYPFFTVDDKYVIPGSSVRGVIRNVYETITDSCFGSVQGNPAITARSSEAFKPGLLIKEEHGWKLYRARKHLVVVDQTFYDQKALNQEGIGCVGDLTDSYKTGDRVHFELALDGNGREIRYEKERNGKRICIGTYVKGLQPYQHGCGMKDGYVCIGERSPRRHFQSIFEQSALEKKIEIGESDIQKLEDVLKEYRDEKKNKLYQRGHKGYPDYERAKKGGVIPVYYVDRDGRLYMTFAALGRKAYSRRWNDVVHEKSHDKCDQRSHLCPACALFGTAKGDKFGSRVRFTDAEYMGDKKSSNKREVTFAELGSPRLSYLPFYLRETGANTDYSIGYDSDQMEIRGRKFYWHHVPDMERRIFRNKRNATFEVIKGSEEFEFRIYFDGITEQQMELLAMAVHLNENDEEGHLCHKMGHGKPLGYGSVKMYIKECKVRVFDLATGWREEKKEIPCDVTCYTCKDNTLRALRTICNFDNFKKLPKGTKVEYPEILLDKQYENRRDVLNDNVLASHRWFTRNYKLGDKKPEQKLPEITDQNLTLQKYMATQITDRDIRNDRRRPGRR